MRNEKLRSYKLIGWIILFLQLIIFIALSFFHEDREIRLKSMVWLGLLGIAFIVMYSLRNSKYAFSLSGILAICTMTWLSLEFYFFATIALLIDILFIISIRPQLTRVNVSGISYPSFPVKKFQWNDLSNTMLKDGLLTIDLRNNKLIQQEVDERQTKVDEKEFNEFCREQLKK